MLSAFKKKIIFKKNKSVDILLLDENYSKLSFSNKSQFILKFDEINIYYILKVLFKYFSFSNLKKKNWKLFYEELNPKVAIGHDINLKIFEFKEMFPEKKTICYQFGHYWEIHIERSQESFKDKKSDYFLTFTDWEQKNIYNKVETQFLTTGSIKNNNYLPNQKKKIYDIMFISEFRDLNPITINKIKKGYHSHTFVNQSRNMTFGDVCNIYILQILNKLEKSLNKKICIALSSNRNDKNGKISQSKEKIFFSEYLKNYYTENLNSNELAEKSNLIICIGSNLGPELLAQGKKVLFLNLNSLTNDWHYFRSFDGPFWYKGKDKDIIEDKIDKLLNLNDIEWKKILEKNSESIMKYDKHNSILRNLVEELCEK